MNPSIAGDLDGSFGSSGMLLHSIPESQDAHVRGIAVQADGKIVVAGGSAETFLLARYLPNGLPDPSFGQGGYVQTRFADWAFAEAVALQPDGKIVVAGSSYPADPGKDEKILSVFTVARYNPDGSLDTGFGTDGITTTAIPEQPGYWSAGANSLAILSSGEILLGGSALWDDGGGGFYSAFALARYTPDGSLDPTFGNGGIAQAAFHGILAGIAAQPDGKIVATGSGGSGIALARFEPDGSLDPTFGHDGMATTAHKLAYGGGPVALQHTKIVVAGSSRTSNRSNAFPVIARYGASGRLDSTFGEHGFAQVSRIGGNATEQGIPSDIVAQNDGRLLISAANSVVRLLPNGRLDRSFGRAGIVMLGHPQNALALQADGKLLVGGGIGNAWTLDRLNGGNNCVVPGLRGKTVSKARVLLRRSYCRSGHISTRFSSTVERGRVISTLPARGARLFGGADVPFIVSRGRQPVHRS